jgi:hypothetical protein
MPSMLHSHSWLLIMIGGAIVVGLVVLIMRK